MSKHKKTVLSTSADTFLFLIVVCFSSVPLHAASGYVRNGSFSQIGAYKTFTQAGVEKLRRNGWTCPDAKDWPTWWVGFGKNAKFDYIKTGGKTGDAYCRISGEGGYVAGYHGLALEERNYVLIVWAKGKGTLRICFHAYAMGDDGKVRGIGPPPPFLVKVDSGKWVRYRAILRKTRELWGVHPTIGAVEGTVDFDEVDLLPSNAALDLIVAEEGKLYGTGALIENMDVVQADEGFDQRRAEYVRALRDFRLKSEGVDKELVESLEKAISTLDPYVVTKGPKAVQALHYNEMIVMTRVLERLVGGDVGKPTPVMAKTAGIAIDYKPGERAARDGKVTITDVHSSKVRYDENETAHTTATIVNKGETARKGALVALMHVDLDTVREIKRDALTLGPSQTKTWRFSYSVGPETYGRGVEVRFVDDKRNVLDSWQEFYVVAAEWFRVQQHTFTGSKKHYKVDPWVCYYNQRHYFASEPTDFGVQVHDYGQYKSGQAGYIINQEHRNNEIAHFSKRCGVKCTFYQTFAFCGQMGYEVMRQHPEYALYDENGQFAVDPIYGGYPNPMELASPIEIGPKRKATKAYLDRKYTPWQHTPLNFAMEETIVFQANCVKKYAEALGFDGVYVDGCMGVWKGYGYDGKPNVPSDRDEDYARLNARNHRVFSKILKEDNPNFGTWFNWSYNTDYYTSRGHKFYLGGGVEGDVSDESIRAAAGWKNVMFLMEIQHPFIHKEGDIVYPAKYLEILVRNRDHIVQKYGGSAINGYIGIPLASDDEPGPSRWGWPTINYFGAQIIATQHHLASFFVPSWRPTLQFMTRYCRFLWARDIKVVPEAEKIVQVSSPEDISWKQLVYKRATEYGYDLIIHLVRFPPTEKWDINWIDEPAPLEGVEVSAAIGAGKLRDVHSARPYYYEEEQQPVQNVLKARVENGKASVQAPPFRYHQMVIFRIQGD